jgi:hypothetical protein
MKKVILILTAFVFSFQLNATLIIKPSINVVENVQSYTFILTHLLGKKLTTPAHFTVGNISIWTLDFRNGDKIRYTIKGKSGSNPLCGLSAIDNLGDYADICVTPGSGSSVTVEISYNSQNFKYTGFLSK